MLQLRRIRQPHRCQVHDGPAAQEVSQLQERGPPNRGLSAAQREVPARWRERTGGLADGGTIWRRRPRTRGQRAARRVAGNVDPAAGIVGLDTCVH